MITEKDRDAFERWLRTYCFQKPTEDAYAIMKDAYLSGAEQARKEAAEIAVEWFKTVFCVPENAKTKGLRAAILGDSSTVSTDMGSAYMSETEEFLKSLEL